MLVVEYRKENHTYIHHIEICPESLLSIYLLNNVTDILNVRAVSGNTIQNIRIIDQCIIYSEITNEYPQTYREALNDTRFMKSIVDKGV